MTDMRMDDQFCNSHDLATLYGDVAINDRGRCIGEVPRFIRPFVRSQFRRAVPDMPIWLDMAEFRRKQFGVSPGVPNVIVFNTTGQECYRIAGELNETQLSELAEVNENGRREAKPK